MAVIDTMSYPIIQMFDELPIGINIDEESMEKVRKEYIKKAIELTQDERRRSAYRYKNEVIEALYGKEREKEMKSVVARLSLGGEAASVELTSEEMAYVAYVITRTYKEKYEDSQRKFPFIATRP